MLKKIFSIFIIICSFSVAYAQKITISQIVSSAMRDIKLSANQQNLAFNQSLNYKLPLLRKVDVRLGTNGNLTADTLDGGLINEDYFALMLSTNNFKEMRLQRAIKQAQSNIYTAENQYFSNQILYERYQAIATIFHAKTLSAERARLQKLLQDKEEVLRLSLEQGLNIRFKDIMDTETDKTMLANALLEFENNITLQEQRVRQFLNLDKNQILDIDFQDFINPNMIELNVKSILKDSNFLHPIIAFRQKQAEFSAAEYRLENAQNRQIFNFIQFGYNYLNYNPLPLKRFNPSNDIAVRLGLTVPLPANNNLKRAQTALKQKEDEQNTILAQAQQSKSIDIQYVKIENILKSLRLNEQNRKESLITKALKSDKILSQLAANEILDLKIADLKSSLKQFELQSELCNEYLRFLELTGAFAREKEKNFLINIPNNESRF
jgi:hypothetical protein